MAHMKSSANTSSMNLQRVFSRYCAVDKAPKVEGRSMTMFLTEKR